VLAIFSLDPACLHILLLSKQYLARLSEIKGIANLFSFSRI
jgi:hypothetical protein